VTGAVQQTIVGSRRLVKLYSQYTVYMWIFFGN